MKKLAFVLVPFLGVALGKVELLGKEAIAKKVTPSSLVSDTEEFGKKSRNQRAALRPHKAQAQKLGPVWEKALRERQRFVRL